MNENPRSPVQLLIAQQFDSFEELSALTVAWDAVFHQLDAERFKSDLFQALVGSILVSRARFGCAVDQHGATPPGMRSFALPDFACPGFRWFGHQIEQNVLLAFPTHGEIAAFNQAGFGVFTLSLPEELLTSYFKHHGNVDFETVLGADEKILAADPLRLNQIRFMLHRFEALIKDSSNAALLPNIGANLQEQVLPFIFDSICNSESLATPSGTAGSRAFARALDYIHDHSNQSVSNAELCTYARVSERTLQSRFKRELGMTPKVYMTGQRLYNVHRALWHADPATNQVTDLANSQGFWHMGQFAADYRRLFANCLPLHSSEAFE